MTGLFRTSIAARSAVVIVSIVAVVGLGFLALAIPLAQQEKSAEQQNRIQEYLDIVQNTVAIACYVSDKKLADEVARGLISTRTVIEVTIRAGNVELAHRKDTLAADSPDTIFSGPRPDVVVRKIASPFNSEEIVGEIVLVPDAAEIRDIVVRQSWFTALLLSGQVALVGLGVVLVVIGFVTRPISTISAKLHELHVEMGQKLGVPRGNETDEIGQLVRDVNVMADRVVKNLNEERELRIQREIGEKKLQAIFEHAHTGLFVIDEAGLLISYNPACARFFGLPEADPSKGPLPMFMDLVGKNRDTAHALIDRAIAENKSTDQDIKFDGKAGKPTRWVNVVLTPIRDQQMQGVVNEITERKRAEVTAQALAVTDSLTGLPNRLGFERNLELLVDDCRDHAGNHFAMLMLDLDRFKEVNDTYGHKAGDDVLIQVARTLEKSVRRTDFVGRLGGDEFVVLLASTSDRAIIETIMRKIISGIGQPIPIEGGNYAKVGVSIGAAVFDCDITSRDDLIARADEAMYRAKEGGRNTFRFSLVRADLPIDKPAPVH
ncbi:MAG: sensor domain-containing diguanylate cyclase [Casimicrobiaceae bacterium]